MLDLIFYFEEISQHARRCAPTLQRARLEESLNRLRRVSMLSNYGFERCALALVSRKLRSHRVEILFALDLRMALLLERLACPRNVLRDPSHLLRRRLEFK